MTRKTAGILTESGDCGVILSFRMEYTKRFMK